MARLWERENGREKSAQSEIRGHRHRQRQKQPVPNFLKVSINLLASLIAV